MGKYYIVYRIIENKYGQEERHIAAIVTNKDIAADICKNADHMYYCEKIVGKDVCYTDRFK